MCSYPSCGHEHILPSLCWGGLQRATGGIEGRVRGTAPNSRWGALQGGERRDGWLDVILRKALSFCRTSSSVRPGWEYEETPKDLDGGRICRALLAWGGGRA